MKLIQEIPAIETFPVRHPVLREGKPVESCFFEGDDLETTRHFGLYDHGHLVAVLSLFEKTHTFFDSGNQFQIRGMAVLKDYRKQGYGEALIAEAEHRVQTLGGGLIWFNAREVAVGFYEKAGYRILGNAFDIPDIGKHFVMYKQVHR